MRNTVSAMAILFALGVACGDDSGSSPDSTVTPDAGSAGDANAPSSSFKGLDPYDVAQGTLSVETETSAGATKVELLADGKVVAESTAAPFTIDWDTTTSDDGIATLTLKAHGGDVSATSDEVPVVVLNNGQEATFFEGSEQTMTIDPALDSHIKVHWTMPSGVKKVIGVVFWDNRAFKMKLDLGTGTCPHSGQTACNTSSDTSPLMAQYPETVVSGTLGEGMWFNHAGATNEADIAGESTKLTFKVFMLQ